MIERKLSKLVLAGLVTVSGGTQALPDIPEEGGWSGRVGFGVGVGSSESNMLAEVFSVDLGDKRVSGLDQSPDDEDIVLPSLQFELAYTFEGMGTQLYLGNGVADHLNFNHDTTLETHFGIRQDVGRIGVVDFSLAASAAPTDVWEDPYLVDEDRGNTERTSNGLHIVWDNILATPVQVSWSSREVEIDDERSGQDGDLELTPDEARALRRGGSIYRLDMTYGWKINARHSLKPGIAYIDYDLDGDAMAMEGPALVVEHRYDRDRWLLATRLYYEDMDADQSNPIYGDDGDVETIGGVITFAYRQPFGLENWSANATAAYYEGDSNIDFYDSSFGLFAIGMQYRFD